MRQPRPTSLSATPHVSLPADSAPFQSLSSHFYVPSSRCLTWRKIDAGRFMYAESSLQPMHVVSPRLALASLPRGPPSIPVGRICSGAQGAGGCDTTGSGRLSASRVPSCRFLCDVVSSASRSSAGADRQKWQHRTAASIFLQCFICAQSCPRDYLSVDLQAAVPFLRVLPGRLHSRQVTGRKKETLHRMHHRIAESHARRSRKGREHKHPERDA